MERSENNEMCVNLIIRSRHPEMEKMGGVKPVNQIETLISLRGEGWARWVWGVRPGYAPGNW